MYTVNTATVLGVKRETVQAKPTSVKKNIQLHSLNAFRKQVTYKLLFKKQNKTQH